MSGEQWGEAVARAFHDAYERLAPQHDYRTRTESAKPWDEVPAANRALMIATVAEVLPLIVADTRRTVAEEQGETFEEWRVTGQPGDGYPAYDFTWTPDRTGPDPERDARSFIRLHDAAGVPWNDGPHLSRRVVTRTAWQAIARGSGNGDSGQEPEACASGTESDQDGRDPTDACQRTQ